MTLTSEDIIAVWAKGFAVGDNDPGKWRKDKCGAWMQFSKYGNRDSDYGWEVDHIIPGDDNSPSNLRPLQWVNNVEKSDGRLTCPMIAQDTHNVRKNW